MSHTPLDGSRGTREIRDTDGNVLGLFRMPDATVFSIDVAVAKARIELAQRDPNLSQRAGGHATRALESVDAAQPGEHILVMSNGGFGGVHEKFLDALGKQAPGKPA